MTYLSDILKKPAHIPLEESRYYMLVRTVLMTIFISHAGWAVFFFLIHIPPLFYFQFFSLAVFCFAYYLNNRRMLFAAVFLGCLEVIVHQFLCVIYMGAQTGFQYYLLIASIMPFLLPPGRLVFKGALLLCNLLGLLAINYIIADRVPIYDIGADLSLVLGITNISVSFVLLGYIAMHFTKAMHDTESELNTERERSDSLLHNILPVHVAAELKSHGRSEPKRFEQVSIMFTDFKGFTELVASIPAITLVDELNDIFSRFDDIMAEEGLEKIQTIGDAYLAACGLPEEDPDHALKCIRAAKQMIGFLEQRNKSNDIQWNMRVGIHTRPIVAGVVGKKKFTYDLFGDTINTASRFETASEPGRINISSSTYSEVSDKVECEYRGKIMAKGKGELDMYFVK